MIATITITIIVGMILLYIAGFMHKDDSDYFFFPLAIGAGLIIIASIILNIVSIKQTKEKSLLYLTTENKVEIKVSPKSEDDTFVLKDSSLTNLFNYLKNDK